jgi:uncharacterized membrane protein (UPF0182 family)
MEWLIVFGVVFILTILFGPIVIDLFIDWLFFGNWN